MTTVTDAQLYEHAARANGKVVIITGYVTSYFHTLQNLDR